MSGNAFVTVLGVFELGVAALAAVLGTFVLLVRPGNPINRFLAAFMGLIFWGAGAHAAQRLVSDTAWDAAAHHVFYGMAFPALWIVYLGFAVHAAPTRGTAWLRTRAARWGVLVLVVVIWIVVAFVGLENRVVKEGEEVLMLAVSLFALGNAIVYRRRASGARRSNATTYLAAFGTQDSGFIIGLTIHAVAQYGYGLETGSTDVLHPAALVADSIIQAGLAGAVVILAFGLFRAQVLDFSFQLHRRLSQTTIAGIFIGLFFVVSELAATLLSERIGPVLGILAAGLLVFAIAPLQRLGDRLGSAVVHDSRPVHRLSSAEHELLFREQLELALGDDHLTVKELQMLESVRVRLGISPEVAARIQKDVAAASGQL